MSEQIDRRISFNAGEISPWLDPRLDLEKYQMGCRQLQNIRPMIYGGALKRAGTQYVGRALNDSTAGRLIPWIGAEGQHYVIELSHLKVRIWDADTLVLEDSLVEMEWNPNTAYVAETVVSFEGQRYEVVVDHTSNAGEVGYEFIGTSLDPEIDSGIFEPTGNIVNGYPEYGFFDPNRGNLGSNYLLQQNFFNDGWNLLLEDVEMSNSPLGWASLPNDIGYYDPDQATSWANSNGLGTITAVNKITVGPGQGLQADIEAGNLRPYPSRELATVFTSEQLAEIQYAQQNDVMYLTHPDHQPQVILRTPSDWLMGDVKFAQYLQQRRARGVEQCHYLRGRGQGEALGRVLPIDPGRELGQHARHRRWGNLVGQGNLGGCRRAGRGACLREHDKVRDRPEGALQRAGVRAQCQL
jgi:hypothetical protein